MNANLLLLIAIFGWGLGGAFQKLAVGRLGAPLTLLVFYAVAFAVTALYCFAGPQLVRWPSSVSALSWSILAALVSASASIAFVTLLQSRDVSSIIGLTACNPIVTFVIAILFLGEQFTMARLIGIVLVLSGILILR